MTTSKLPSVSALQRRGAASATNEKRKRERPVMLRLYEEEWEILRKFAFEQRLPLQRIIWQALDAYMRKHGGGGF
jgi:predicted DNA binding CopG/RHH family protein